MGLITIICFLTTTLTISIMSAMLSLELITKGGLSAANPVHLVCLAQTIFMVVVVAGLLILGGE